MSLQGSGRVQPAQGGGGGGGVTDTTKWRLYSLFGPISGTNMGDPSSWSWTSTDFSSSSNFSSNLGPYLSQVSSAVIGNATSTYPSQGGVTTLKWRITMRVLAGSASGLENDVRYFVGILCGAGTITSYPASPGAGRSVSYVWDDTNGADFMIADNVGAQTRTASPAGSLVGHEAIHVVESDGVDITWTVYDGFVDPNQVAASHTWVGAIATLTAGLTVAQTFFRPFFVNQTDIASNAFMYVGRGTVEAGYPEAP